MVMKITNCFEELLLLGFSFTTILDEKVLPELPCLQKGYSPFPLEMPMKIGKLYSALNQFMSLQFKKISSTESIGFHLQTFFILEEIRPK